MVPSHESGAGERVSLQPLSGLHPSSPLRPALRTYMAEMQVTSADGAFESLAGPAENIAKVQTTLRTLATMLVLANKGQTVTDIRQKHVRWMIRKDMPQVLDAEEDTHVLPWDEERFVESLRKRNVIGMVVEEQGREAADYVVTGSMVYALQRESLDLQSINVKDEHRTEGVPDALLAKLLSKLSAHRRTSLTESVIENHRGTLVHVREALAFLECTNSEQFLAQQRKILTTAIATMPAPLGTALSTLLDPLIKAKNRRTEKDLAQRMFRTLSFLTVAVEHADDVKSFPDEGMLPATIRGLTESEVDVVSALTGPITFTEDDQNRASHLNVSPLATWSVAEVGGEPVGFIATETAYSPEHEAEYMKLHRFTVAPKYAGKGVGNILAAFAVDEMKRTGVGELTIESDNPHRHPVLEELMALTANIAGLARESRPKFRVYLQGLLANLPEGSAITIELRHLLEPLTKPMVERELQNYTKKSLATLHSLRRLCLKKRVCAFGSDVLDGANTVLAHEMPSNEVALVSAFVSDDDDKTTPPASVEAPRTSDSWLKVMAHDQLIAVAKFALKDDTLQLLKLDVIPAARKLRPQIVSSVAADLLRRVRENPDLVSLQYIPASGSKREQSSADEEKDVVTEEDEQ